MKAPENCHNFDAKSDRCKGCDGWGECAIRNPAQFKVGGRK